MKDERTGKDLRLFQPLDKSQVYIYILRNSVGKVKVGKTSDINQRVQSLSGSNSQGNILLSCYLSEPTYLQTIERIMHSRMDYYRIPNTEWFYYEEDPTGEIMFDSAIELLEKLFYSKSYKRCNELRKKYGYN